MTRMMKRMNLKSTKKLKKIGHKLLWVPKSAHQQIRQLGISSPSKTLEGSMASSTDTSSSANDYETFADEVHEAIPEVDHKGRIQRSSADSVEDGEKNAAAMLSQVEGSLVRSDKAGPFWRALLSTKSPYDEFHHLFKSVPKDQFPINDFSCALSREILLQGRMYISQGWFCFYSNIFGWETQVTIDCSKIVSITREKTVYVVPNAILICTEEEKHFFSSFLSRETVYKLLFQVWEETCRKSKNSSQLSISDNESDKLQETEFQEDVKLEEQDKEHKDESQDTNENCQEDDGFCVQCQEKRNSTCRQHKNDLATSVQLLTRHGSKDSLSRKGGGRKSGKVDRGQVRLGLIAKLVVMLASLAEMLYSYVQVSIRLTRRLSFEQLFILISSFLIVLLMLSSCYLFYRISILEPRIQGTTVPSESVSVHESVKQILKLRQEVFIAEVTRFKTIIAANLEAITQVRESLKTLQENLKQQFKKNCSYADDESCNVL